MHLQPATMQDWKLLLEWRNDLDTRKNSNCMEKISEESHKAWLQSVIDSGNRKLYIVFENAEPVGTVRADLDPASNVTELSWTTSPSSRGKGYGKQMVKLIGDHLGGKLMARIKTGNNSSIRIAEHAGLKFKREVEGVLFFENF